jgi:hypothetical protein
MIAGHWGVRRLNREIATRLGRRRQGGRKPRVADDVAGVLVQLDVLLERWSRWEGVLSRRPVYKRLRPKVRDGIKQVNLAVTALRKAAARRTPSL